MFYGEGKLKLHVYLQRFIPVIGLEYTYPLKRKWKLCFTYCNEFGIKTVKT